MRVAKTNRTERTWLFVCFILSRLFPIVYKLPMRQNSFYFSDAGKFCLVHGLRQLTRDIKHYIRTLNFISDATFAPPRKTPNDVRKRSLCDVNVKSERNDE